MSSGEFLSPLRVEEIDDDHWRLQEALVYRSARLKRTVTVPAGFETDFASVPRLPFVYWLVGGKATKAAVVHDFLYRRSGVSREDADAVFAEAMGASGQSWWRRGAMWAGLRVFGWTAYKPNQDEEPKGETP